jgi:hypothetical protein
VSTLGEEFVDSPLDELDDSGEEVAGESEVGVGGGAFGSAGGCSASAVEPTVFSASANACRSL